MTLSQKLQQIDSLQQQINAHGPLSAELQKRINYKFRLDWNYYSNAMEGGTLTREETRSVMVGNITVDGKPLRDVIEMNGHDEIVREILAMGTGDVRISESRIKAIHRAIMFEEEETKKQQIGQWKKEGNHIINYKGEKFDFMPPDEVPDRIHQLLNETNAALDALSITKKKKDRKHPVLIALEFHLAYVTIHPFYDGNGRTGRILMNLLLIAAGYPPIIIRTDEKERYYRYLADIQCYGGQPDLLYDFLAGLLIRSQQLVLDAIAGKDIEEMEDWEKELELLRQQNQEPAQLESKTEDLIKLRMEDSFLPFFDKLYRKLSKFNEHFAVSELQTEIRGNIVLFKGTSLTENLGYLAEEGKLHHINAIELSCNWQGYRNKAISSFSLQETIGVDLTGEFHYVIYANKSSVASIEQSFTQPLTETQINQFVNQLGKDLLTNMQQRVSEQP